MSESSESDTSSYPTVFVVDSWIVLEWLYRTEPARTYLRRHLESAELGHEKLLMSRINFGEVYYSLVRKVGHERAEELMVSVRDLPIEIVSVEDAMVDEAAELKSRYSVSYADCFAAVLAQRHEAPVITEDLDFKLLAIAGVLTVEWAGA